MQEWIIRILIFTSPKKQSSSSNRTISFGTRCTVQGDRVLAGWVRRRIRRIRTFRVLRFTESIRIAWWWTWVTETSKCSITCQISVITRLTSPKATLAPTTINNFRTKKNQTYKTNQATINLLKKMTLCGVRITPQFLLQKMVVVDRQSIWGTRHHRVDHLETAIPSYKYKPQPPHAKKEDLVKSLWAEEIRIEEGEKDGVIEWREN